MKRIYISGKISDLPKEEYIRHFARAEEHLNRQGYTVINPAKVNAQLPDMSWDEYMDMSFTMLTFCRAIYMLDNWESSRGARIEYSYASRNKYLIMYEKDEICTNNVTELKDNIGQGAD